MAAMDQSKLNNMVSKINNEATNYVTEVKNAVDALKGEFNTNWVSTAAQGLATEIKTCVESLTQAITDTFANKNEGIKYAVQNFNAVEQENISYSGFSFSKPLVDMTLNSALASGKVGVAEGADLNSIKTPMNTLVSKVTDTLNSIKTAVSQADAFDRAEQEALTSSIETIKSAFVTKMEELKQSLDTRMSGEIEERDRLNQTNISNLSA